MTGRRRSMAALSVAVLLPACASSRGASVRVVADAPSASPASQPEPAAGCSGERGRALVNGVVTTLTVSMLMMLRGAAVGALVGVTVGVMKGLEQAWQRPACLVARAADTDARLTAPELETLLPDD